METIDITPTWQSIVPYLILIIRDGNAEGQKAAKEELMRLAKLADDINAKQRNKEHENSIRKPHGCPRMGATKPE